MDSKQEMDWRIVMNGKQTLLGALALVVGLGLAQPTPVAAQSAEQTKVEQQKVKQETVAQYQLARRLLNSAQWIQAVDNFRLYRKADAGARYAAESLYWEAYALSRMESTRHWRQALTALEMQLDQYPGASTADDTKALLAKVHGELANRGDSKSAEWVYRQAEWAAQYEAEQDEGPDETKLMALNALMQMDSDKAIPILRKLIEDKDNDSELRSHALFVLMQQEGDGVTDFMLDVARNDPDLDVRQQAVFWLSQHDSPETVAVLRSILSSSADSELHGHAVHALSQMSDPAAMTILREFAGSESADPGLRAQAVFGLSLHASNESSSFLRDLFASSQDSQTRESILFALSQMPNQGNAEWLMNIALDTSEGTEMRTQALFMASQAGTVSVADLIGVYDRAEDSELKGQTLFILGQQEEPAAFDKLLDVARNDSDQELRKNAIFWLGQSGDPRAEQVLLDILEE